MRHTIQAWSALGFALILSALTGCAQARQGLGAGTREVELWEPQELCTNADGQDTLACVTIQLNISDEVAHFEVEQLGFDPGATPYRIYGRVAGNSVFVQLADNVTIAAGGAFDVHAKGNTHIKDYEEWIIELSQAFDSNGFLVPAAPLQGVIAARAIIDWPELYTTNSNAVKYP